MAVNDQIQPVRPARSDGQVVDTLTSAARKVAASTDRRVISREVDAYMREGRAALRRSEARRVQQMQRGR